MPNPLSRTLRAYAADARAAATSAPVEVALGLLLALTLSVQVRSEPFGETGWVRLAGSVALGFPLVFAASVGRARGAISPRARWAATAAILASCAAFGLLWFDPDRSAHGWRWLMLSTAAALILALGSGVPRAERDRRRAWAFAWRLAERLVGVGLYAVALYGILAGAFAAVVNLFDLKRPEHLFTDLAGAVFFGVAPWIFVGGIHRLVAPPPDGVPVAVSRLGRWLYAPVLVIYLAILYAYALKVLATGELPKNLVSPLVIAAGTIGFVGAVLLEPVHGDDEHRGLAPLIRWMPALLLPLVPLAFWSVLVRLGQYGWTEFRYLRVTFLVVLAILAVLGTLRLARRGPPLMTTIPRVTVAALLLASVGPWGALAVSKRDQTSRLRSALAAARVDARRLPRDTVAVDPALYDRIDGGARYLLEAHGRGALRAVIPALPDGVHPTWWMAERLGIRRGCDEAGRRAQGGASWRGGVPGVMTGTLVRFAAEEGRWEELRVGPLRVTATLERDRVVVAGPAWRAEASVAPLRDHLVSLRAECSDWLAPPPTDLPARMARIDLMDAEGRVRAQLVVERFNAGGPIPRKNVRQAPGNAVREIAGILIVGP